MKYRKNFKKTVWGYVEVEAETKEEAMSKLTDSECTEHENSCDYEFEENWEVK